MTLNSLNKTKRRLLKQSDLGENYYEIIDQHIKKQYLEYVDVKNDKNDCQYLPHLLVVRPDISTTKVRIVFDEAAKQVGKSLNDVTHQSSQLQKDLVSVL